MLWYPGLTPANSRAMGRVRKRKSRRRAGLLHILKRFASPGVFQVLRFRGGLDWVHRVLGLVIPLFLLRDDVIVSCSRHLLVGGSCFGAFA